MYQKNQNPWLALQEQEMPLMLQGVPYVDTPPPAMGFPPADVMPAQAPVPKFDQLMNQLERKSVQGIGDQRKSIEQLQKYKDAILNSGGGQMDLTPLMKLADTWTGSRLAQGYQAPEGAGQKLNRAMGVEQQIANQQGKIADDEIGLLRTQLMGEAAKARVNKGKELTPPAILKVNEGNAIPGLLSEVAKTIDANQDYFGYKAGLANTELGRFAMPKDYEKSKTIDSQMRASSQAFGKYMEGGVLRKEDEEKYRKMFPQITDTPQVAKNKLAVVQNMLVQKQQSDLNALQAQGYDITGLQLPAGSGVNLPNILTGKSNKPKTVIQNGFTYTLNEQTGEYE